MARSFFVGATISDAIVMITLISAVVYKKDYLTKSKLEDKASLEEDIRLIKNEMSAIKLHTAIKAKSPLGQVTFVSDDQIKRF